MSRKFQVKVIPSEWIRSDGHRLDCGPYLSGAIEAKELLRKFDNEPLKSITSGIFHAGRESRMWVETAEYGVPFMGSTDILATDYDNLPFISKKQVKSNPAMILHKGTSLITRSGTIGRMAYCRADMDGLACSEHAMRVVPNEEKVKSGYLYAFLSSRFGIPIVVSGTYGSIIQSIEPQHLEGLPVPRLGAVEQQTHDLVQRAADLQVESTDLLRKAGQLINDFCGFPMKLALSARVFSFGSADSEDILKRLDATFHSPIAQQADSLLYQANGVSLVEAGITVLESNRMKQVFVDEQYGTPFITSGGIFMKSISPERHLRKTLLGEEDTWRINEKDSLIARSGQVGGIIGESFGQTDGLMVLPHRRIFYD